MDSRLERYVFDNLPSDEARLRWIAQGRPLGITVRSIAEGEEINLSLDALLIAAVCDAMRENPLGAEGA